MTKKILETNLKEIKGIKIVCNECDAYWFVPLNSADPPAVCFSCDNRIPKDIIWKAKEGLLRLNNSMKNYKFKAFIETEEE